MEPTQHLDANVQQVIDALVRSRDSHSAPGAGYFAEAMHDLLDIAVAEANDAGPAPAQSERLWSAVHETITNDPGKLYAFAWRTKNAALSAFNEGWNQPCWDRSVLEFLRAHPKFVDFGEPLDDAVMADIDEAFREQAPDADPLSPEEIPDGMPTSHWWWWAPSGGAVG